MNGIMKSCSMEGMTARSLLKLTGFLMIGLLFLPWLLHDSDGFHRFIDAYLPSQIPFSVDPALTADAPRLKLINDIRERVKIATNGLNVTFSAVDREAWDNYFPCRSRVELNPFYEKRKHVEYVPPNQLWQEVFDEYAILHRVCMSRVGDLKEYVSSKNHSTGCKFVVAEAHYGLGNKLLHMVSMFMYAVLTQRVILIPESTSVPPIMCEPFPGSSWSLSDENHQAIKSNRTKQDELYTAIDDDLSNTRPINIYAAQGGGVWGPEIRFWCDTEQDLFSTVTWLTFDGCLHTIPKLFSIAKFRPILEAIFPTRVVITHVLRTVMLPADPVWNRVVRNAKESLAGAEMQLGVQVRFLRGKSQYMRDNKPINRHITQCLLRNGFLPELCPEMMTQPDAPKAGGRFVNCSSTALRSMSPAPVTKVLVASLFLGFKEHLEKIYRQSETVNRETVSIVQFSHEKTQGSGVPVDSQALMEIIALSFSDILLVTPFSTFGGVAQAYGALVPYFIEYNISLEVPCQRGLTTEPCNLGAIANYDCRYDPPKNRNVVDIVPYLQRCMFIDVGEGYSMLLMNKN